MNHDWSSDVGMWDCGPAAWSFGHQALVVGLWHVVRKQNERWTVFLLLRPAGLGPNIDVSVLVKEFWDGAHVLGFMLNSSNIGIYSQITKPQPILCLERLSSKSFSWTHIYVSLLHSGHVPEKGAVGCSYSGASLIEITTHDVKMIEKVEK